MFNSSVPHFQHPVRAEAGCNWRGLHRRSVMLPRHEDPTQTTSDWPSHCIEQLSLPYVFSLNLLMRLATTNFHDQMLAILMIYVRKAYYIAREMLSIIEAPVTNSLGREHIYART